MSIKVKYLMENLGMSQRAVAKELGLKLHEVSKICIDNNYGSRKYPVTTDLKEQATRMFVNGITIKSIVEQLGISRATVVKATRGVTRESLGKSDANKAKALELYNSGVSVDAICSMLDRTKYYVHSYLGITRGNKKDEILKLIKKGLNPSAITCRLGITEGYYYKVANGMKHNRKVYTRKKVAKPAIVNHAVLNKGVERGIVDIEPKLSADRDKGRLVKFLYSQLFDKPTKPAEIRVKDDVSDEVAVQRWANRMGVKSWAVC